MLAWSLLGRCGECSVYNLTVKWHNFLDKKLPVPVIPVLSVMNSVFELLTELATPEPSLYSTFSCRSTWPCVLGHCLFGTSKCDPCAAFRLMSGNSSLVFFDKLLHSSCHHFRPGFQCLGNSQIPRTSTNPSSYFIVGIVHFSSCVSLAPLQT